MPLLGPTMEDRNEVFQRLKPPCVALSQALLGISTSRGQAQDVMERLESLRHVLKDVTRKNTLDDKLADYVFFPLSQVLKLSQKVSIRCLELTLFILALLVAHGWQQRIQIQLAKQLLILCTLLSSKKPTAISSAGSTVELQENALLCLKSVFNALAQTADGTALLTGESHVPQLGQTISTILDSIHEGGNVEVQVAATHALESLIRVIDDREILAGFLPGMVSSLTKVLTPQTSERRNHVVLFECLNILSELLKLVLGDKSRSGDDGKSIIDEKWLENAASQLRPALASVFRLRSHARDDVKESVARLALVLLGKCRRSLSNCSSMALENLITLSLDNTLEPMTKNELELLVVTDSGISASLEGVLHGWLQSLARVMQSTDDQAKSRRIQQIAIAYELLVKTDIDSTMLDGLLAQALQDSIVLTVQESGAKPPSLSDVSHVQSFDLTVLDEGRQSTEFQPSLARHKHQQETADSIGALAIKVVESGNSTAFVSDLVRSFRHSLGDAQVSSFWLLLTSIEHMTKRDADIDAMFDFGDDRSMSVTEHLEEIYSFSLSALSTVSDEPADPRLLSLALRTLALRAQTVRQEFRYELIDALYPVLHTLSTPNEQLQQDSITTLNIFTEACSYPSVKELVVDNVDYLTNAVALKLNAFDVSPQAPQVLLMMVRLAGPSLLPYLEDTVDSIFAALEDYHGYPLLVELLFKVLGVMAEEGVKAPQLAITSGAAAQILHAGDEKWKANKVDDLLRLLREKREKTEVATQSARIEPGSFPRRPWKELKDSAAVSEEEEEDAEDEPEEDNENHGMVEADPPPPAPKTYSLLHKITELTQHYLPSASPSLRTSLLALIRTTVPAIAKHENTFLPLINTLWPEIVSRLTDGEPHVQAAALDIVSLLCEHAKDFMRSRVVQLWPEFQTIYEKLIREIVDIAPAGRGSAKQTSKSLVPSGQSLKQAVLRMQAGPGDYSNTSARMLWQALVRLMTMVVQYVSVTPVHFDEALDVVEPILDKDDDVRAVFEEENADAVWLRRARASTASTPERPSVPNGSNWQFARVSW